MPPPFGNCAYSYENNRGKPVYVPSDDGRKIGRELKRKVERRFDPPAFYFHLREGGHVAAIHAHRAKKYFARVDIENFFYSISRNRVARGLRSLELAGSERYAKWSTVKNPYGTPSYSLPYGFVQSPILASLVLAQSPLGIFLNELAERVLVSVYMDDIAISGNNRRVLERAYRKLRRKCAESNLPVNEGKSCPPGLEMELFNCHLTHLQTLVTDARREAFYSVPRTDLSQTAFEEYCLAIEDGNG